MKKLFVLALLFVASVSMFAYEPPIGGQNEYIPDCPWRVPQEMNSECFQDWYLFAYWPLDCDPSCEEAICLGLFPSTENTQGVPYDLPTGDDAICCKWTVSGQLGWSFDADLDFTYHDSFFDVFFDVNVDEEGDGYTLLTNTASDVNPLGTFTLDYDGGAGHGEAYFQLCATKVVIYPGANGELNLTTTLNVIYEM